MVLILEGPGSSATEHCFLELYDCNQAKIGILLRRLGLRGQSRIGDQGTLEFFMRYPIG